MSSPTPAEYEAMLETVGEKARLALLMVDIDDAFNRRGELDAVLQGCTDALVNHLNATFARIWVLDAAGEVLELRASSGLYTHLDGPHGRIKMGDFKIGRIAQKLQAHVSNSVTTDPEIGDPEWARREKIISFAGCPLTLEGKALGVVAFFAQHPLSDGVIKELEPIADGFARWIRRKQTESALAQQQEWLNVTLKSIGDAVIVTDIGGRIAFMNPVAEDLTGWKLNEALGKPLEDVFRIVNEASRQPIENPVTKVLHEQRAVAPAHHTLLIAKDGTARPVGDSAAPLRAANGEITGVVLVFRDMSDHRKAEIAARRLAAIVHSSDDAIIGKDLSGIITDWNEGAKRIFGYSDKEVVGQSIMLLIPSELRDEEKSILARLQKGQRIDHFETTRVAKGGNAVQVSLTVSPIRDADGTVVGASKIARDITERRRIEDALAKAQQLLQVHTTELEDRVEARTKTLQKTVAELEAFSYSLSHDMRAPLRAVQSYLQFFIEDHGAGAGPDGLALLYKVIASAQRMDRMVLDLLTFTRLSHEEMRIEPVDVAKLIHGIINDRPELQSPKARIMVEDPLPMVMGNEGSLIQCFTNLLDNAVKFVAPGVTPSVRIFSERVDSMVRLWVEDNGIGLNPQEQGQLFRMFQRLHGNNYPGTGIGLAIVRKAVERMGGSAGLDSAPGEGSQFWLQLQGV